MGEEKLAAFMHLLGDYALDIMPEVLGLVLGRIRKGELEPPYYVETRNGAGWDLDAATINTLRKEWSQALVRTLKSARRRNNR
jgi:hypothetical protein